MLCPWYDEWGDDGPGQGYLEIAPDQVAEGAVGETMAGYR